ncbi:MAG: lolD [Chlamydiia bacterium]|nr:lolD [Chlamydiia bacterium]
MNQTPLLIAEKVTKRFKEPTPIEILKGIDFALYSGKSAAIVGKSGEGKTTLLHILGTIDTPSDGVISIAGIEITEQNRDQIRNQEIGFIFQGFHLLSDYTALDNVLMPLKIGRQATAKGSLQYKRGCDLLEMVGLQDRMHHQATMLSGGERQRVAIARAFINNPKIILADEPTGNLDHQTAEEIETLLLRCVKAEDKGLLVVTHNLKLANLLDACYELESGHLYLRESKDAKDNSLRAL